MNSDLLPGDEGWPEDKVLIADLSSLNAGIARYIVRHLDADAGHAEPISVEDEQAFGLKLVKLGNQLQRRAAGENLRPVRSSRVEASHHRHPNTDSSPAAIPRLSYGRGNNRSRYRGTALRRIDRGDYLSGGRLPTETRAGSADQSCVQRPGRSGYRGRVARRCRRARRGRPAQLVSKRPRRRKLCTTGHSG